ncbi:MAG: HAD family hydrolase [Oscillospiraceae bacterium]|nr:HAD family hydrolase [Oscillospiraceae bacterium]
MIKLVIFDMLGVVFPNMRGGSYLNINELYLKIKTPKISFDDFFSKYQKLIIGDINISQFWENVSDGDIKVIETEHLNNYKIYPNIQFILQKLKEYYNVISITNHPTSWIQYVINRNNLNGYFDKIYVSEDVKLKKPQEKLYNLALKEFGVKPIEAVIIDDQIKNLMCASELGMKTILFGSNGTEGFVPAKSITSFENLVDIVNDL